MPAPAAIATHARAGRLEPTRLALRTAAVEGPGTEIAAEVPFAVGWTPLGSAALGIEVRADGAVAHLDVSVRNAGATPLALAGAAVGLRWRRPGAQALRYLRHGWQSWSFTGSRPLDAAGERAFPSGAWLRGLHHAVGAQPEDRAGWHESDLVTVVGASPEGPVCCVGALERGRAFGVIYLRREGDDVAIELELRVDAELAPGEERALERVRVALGDDASALLEDFALEHGRSADARAAHPFVSGWCSWYHFFHDVTEADVLRNLEALAAARDEIPVEVVQLDDGYQRAVGDWLETNAKFPSGLARLAADIDAAGFVPGIWTAPFCAVGTSRLVAEHRDWLLRSADAPEELHRGLHHAQWSPDGAVYALDPSNEAVVDHLRALFAELTQRGYRYFKLDFLFAVAMRARAHVASLSPATRLRRGLEAVRAGAGEEAFLLGCGCPLGPAVGVVDGMRIGPDVAPHWEPAPEARIPGIEETLPAVRSALRSTLGRAWTHRRLWANDPDCLLARSDALDDREVRTLAAAVAGSGGSFFFSDDFASLSPPRRALVREAFELARRVDGAGLPGAARAPDLLAAEIPTQLAAEDGASAFATLVNAGETPALCEAPLAALGVDGWTGEPVALLGTREAKFEEDALRVELAPRESACAELPRELRLIVFCDFDGTFSVQDVGSTLARRHAGDHRPRVWARYERGEITAWEYNLEVLDGLALPRAEVERFLATVELDPGAAELLAWCAARGVAFRILSDGFDANLNRLQQIHGVRFAYDANQLRYEAGRWRIRAGYPNPDCGCGTGTCKRARIEAFRAQRPGVTAVHIGNGRVSDLCGALAADRAFAKDTLAEELAARGHPYEPFETLRDVIPVLEGLA